MGKLAKRNQVMHDLAGTCQDISVGFLCDVICMILNERKPSSDLHFKSITLSSVRRRDGERRSSEYCSCGMMTWGRTRALVIARFLACLVPLCCAASNQPADRPHSVLQ